MYDYDILSLTNENIENIFNLNFSEINIAIYCSGIQNISFIYCQIKFFINDIQTEKIEKEYYFQNEINYIIIKWYNLLTDYSSMFKDLNNLIEKNLSKFKTSIVAKKNNMFSGCNYLISLNLSNLNTS